MNCFLFLVAALSQVQVAPAEKPIRIVCIGDSITEGTRGNVYPTALRGVMGPGYVVGNFGVGGATLLPGAAAYVNTPTYAKMLRSQADIVIACLGTNDTKPTTWAMSKSFVPTYMRLIASIRALPSKPQVFVCLPPDAANHWGINGTVLKTQVLPMIRLVAQKTGARLIDLNAPFAVQTAAGTPLYTDQVHPNAAGAKLIATTVAAAIRAKNRVENQVPGRSQEKSNGAPPQAPMPAAAPAPVALRYTASAELILPASFIPSIPTPQIVNTVVELRTKGKTYRLTSTLGSFWLLTKSRRAKARLFLVQNRGDKIAGQYGFGSSPQLKADGVNTTAFTFPFASNKTRQIIIAAP